MSLRANHQAVQRPGATNEGDLVINQEILKMSSATGTGKYERLLERCKTLAPVPTAVAHPCEESALTGAVEAAEAGLILPILVGPAEKIAETAKSAGLDLGKLEIVDTSHSVDSARQAVALVREGRAEVLMMIRLRKQQATRPIRSHRLDPRSISSICVA